MTSQEVWGAWSFDPLPTAAVVVFGTLYLAALRRAGRVGLLGRGRPGPRPWCFYLGLAIVIVALQGPPDSLGESSFSAHMVQHLLLQMVAAPLLLLGAPVLLVLQADPPWLPRRVVARAVGSRAVGWLTRPGIAFAAFAVVMVGTHLSPFYDLALHHERVHQLEHVAYLVTALMFWWPVIGVEPSRHRMTPPAQVFYLFLAMPVMALLGMSIAGSDRVMYEYYAANPPPWSTPLQDQHTAGTLLWVAGMFTTVPAIAAVAWRGLAEDARRQERREAYVERRETGASGAVGRRAS